MAALLLALHRSTESSVYRLPSILTGILAAARTFRTLSPSATVAWVGNGAGETGKAGSMEGTGTFPSVLH